MKRADAVLAGLVVASLAVAVAMWSPFLLPPYTDAEFDAGPPRGVRATKTTPTPKLTWTAPPTPTPGATKTTPTDWAAETEKAYLIENRLYVAGKVPAVKCSFPTGSLRTKAALLTYSQSVVACLDKAWNPLLTKAAIYFEPAKVYLYSGNESTACGRADEGAAAFYCSSNHAIYLDWKLYVEGPRSERLGLQIALQYTMAHEYGHHLQAWAGITNQYNQRYWATEGAARLEESRRLELQASCFAAAFFGANQRTLNYTGNRLERLQYHQYGGDDPDLPKERDHGSAKNNRSWSQDAFKSAGPGSCITWAASPKRVS